LQAPLLLLVTLFAQSRTCC